MRKRGRRDHNRNSNNNNNRYSSQLNKILPNRGDISMFHGDCDGKLMWNLIFI